MRKAPLVMATTALVASIVGGCAQTEAGQPASDDADRTSATGPSESPTEQPPGQPQQSAPRVDNPKDAGQLASPCDALTAEQVTQLGLDPSTRREIQLGGTFTNGCAWDTDDVSWGVGFGFDTTHDGLTTTYRSEANYQHFEPRTIDGYPAVDAQTVYNAEDCYSYVGLADTQLLGINVDNSPTRGQAVQPACERVDQIVRMIIGNLPPLK